MISLHGMHGEILMHMVAWPSTFANFNLRKPTEALPITAPASFEPQLRAPGKPGANDSVGMTRERGRISL
jgi:hypothetical protein